MAPHCQDFFVAVATARLTPPLSGTFRGGEEFFWASCRWIRKVLQDWIRSDIRNRMGVWLHGRNKEPCVFTPSRLTFTLNSGFKIRAASHGFEIALRGWGRCKHTAVSFSARAKACGSTPAFIIITMLSVANWANAGDTCASSHPLSHHSFCSFLPGRCGRCRRRAW